MVKVFWLWGVASGFGVMVKVFWFWGDCQFLLVWGAASGFGVLVQVSWVLGVVVGPPHSGNVLRPPLGASSAPPARSLPSFLN